MHMGQPVHNSAVTGGAHGSCAAQEEQGKAEAQNASLESILQGLHRQLDTYEGQAVDAEVDMRRQAHA